MLKHGDFVALDVYHFKRQGRHDIVVPPKAEGCLQPLGYLSSNVTHLAFGYNFNQPLKEGYVPSNLNQLTFGSRRLHWFNQPLNEGYLPSNLTQHTFGYHFNQPSMDTCHQN